MSRWLFAWLWATTDQGLWAPPCGLVEAFRSTRREHLQAMVRDAEDAGLYDQPERKA